MVIGWETPVKLCLQNYFGPCLTWLKGASPKPCSRAHSAHSLVNFNKNSVRKITLALFDLVERKSPLHIIESPQDRPGGAEVRGVNSQLGSGAVWGLGVQGVDEDVQPGGGGTVLALCR